MLDENKVAALEEMAMSITRMASSVQDLVTQGQARMPVNCKCTIAPLDPHENLRDAKAESEAYELDARTADIETEMDSITAADARLAEKSSQCPDCGLRYLRVMGHNCYARTIVAEKNRPSGIDWQQRISRALGVRLGQITLPLEEAAARIEAMVELVNRVQLRCDLCGDWYGYGAEHACRPKEAPVDNMIRKECQYCGHTELLSVDQLGKAQESGEALHTCHIGELIHKALVTNELINVYDAVADFDDPTRWLSYQFHKQANGIKSPLALRRMLQLTGPQFQYLVGVYSKTRKVNPIDIKQARDKYPSE